MRSRPILAAATSLGIVLMACGDDSTHGVAIVRSQDVATAATTGGTGSGTGTGTATTNGPGSPADTSIAGPTTGGGDDAFGWQPFGSGLETGNLTVPIDYDDPSQGTFDLFVARHRATDPAKRIGTLLVNPGGPGFGGSSLVQAAENLYSKALLESFDIVGWDPRGTGLSTPPIDCIDDYDTYFAPDYEGLSADAAQQLSEKLAQQFEAKCEQSNRAILSAVGTNNSARDMDAIRRALGEDTISYFGFSYGSELGATWATLFPDTVRAAVLDGAADPNADAEEGELQQSRGFEAALNTFLAQCSSDTSCDFHNDGDAEGAYDALAQSLGDTPIPSEAGRPDVGPGILTSAVIQAMYSETFWPQLASALAAAQKGDGKGLLELYDAYYQRRADGTYDNSLEAFQVISCADDSERLSVEQADAQVPTYVAAAPRLYGDVEGGGSYFCTFFPASADPRVAITGKGAGPILVVGTTGDPATPLESSRNMATTLEDGVLLTVKADQHTGYDVNDCSRAAVDDYLVALTVPAEGTTC